MAKCKNNEHYFLQRGGEMGELIRAKDWNNTPLGDPSDWPQSLKNMVSVILENPFGMYIAWGKEYTQIYNDGYRPILGRTKHPLALGISTRETFSEIWHIIESMFDGVMNGLPVGFPDFMLPLDRNGYLETCYFDFAYSPIRLDNGEVGGVLVTVIETTNKKKAEDAQKESKNQLEFAIDAAQLGTFDYNPVTNKFSANNRLKEWFGLPADEQVELTDAVNAIHPDDQERVSFAIREALEYSSGGKFNVEYTIVNPVIKKETIVHAKGKTWFDEKNIAYRLNGTLEDVTEQTLAQRKTTESEINLRLMIAQAPMAIAIMRGEDYTVEIVNKHALELWGRKEEQVMGMSVFTAMPELLDQGIKELLDNVITTGNRFATNELPVQLLRKGGMETIHINFSYEPLYDENGKTNGIMAIGFDVSPHVLARKKIEESEQDIRALVEGAPFPIGVYTGEEMRITFANQSIMDIWEKGNDVVGKLYTDILPELEHQQIFEQVSSVLISGIPFHAKNQRVDLMKDGVLKSFYFNYSFSPLSDASGKVWGVMNTAAEVTELNEAKQRVEESEKRFKNSVQQAPLGIAIFRGPDFIVEQANDVYLLIVDKNADEFIGFPIFKSLPEVKDLVEPLFNEVVNTGKPFYGDEFPAILKREGKLDHGFFNLVYHPLKEEDGSISGIMVVCTEVTATVKAKHLLEEREKHFRSLVMQSPIPMTILRGSDFIIESANTVMFENVWRRKEVDVIGKSILEVFPELKEQKYPELMNKVFSLGKSHSEKESVAYVQGDDGMKNFYLDYEYAPLFESDGQVSGIMITVNDVTDKVEARKKVEEAEERSRLAVEATELATWELDVHTKEIIHSPRLAEIFGHEVSQKLTLAEIRNQIITDDRTSIVEKAFDKALETGVFFFEARLSRVDNSIGWIKTQGKTFYNEKNEPIRIIGTIRDITKEKQLQQILLEREQKFRLLADSMPQHIWTSDTEGNLNYFNQSVFDYSGLTLEQINKDGWMQIVHPDDREKNIEEWMNSINTGKYFLIEHRFRKHDGEYRWQLSRAIPQKDKHGKITMWVGTSTDIQDQKMFADELEKQVAERTKELNQNNIDLEKMNKELQSFAYISSHDLQEPLRKIQTFATLISEKESHNLSENGKDRFERMRSAANRMQVLIQDLLAYSRTNTQEGKFKNIGLEVIIAEVKEDLKEELEQKNAIIEMGEMCEVKVIQFQFRQLLYNLVSNSLKFSSDERLIRMKMSCEIAKGAKFNNEQLSSDINYYHINFEDNGIGFEQQYNERIFEVFQRLHGKQEYKGTGIGLAIVKKIVENHNGIIVANGKLNKGATFDIYIPAT